VASDSVEDLKRAAKAAEDAFEERLPYLLWNEASATTVIGNKETSDDDYHRSLDSWEEDVRNMLDLSTSAAEAEKALSRAIYKKSKLERSLGKIAEFKAKRDVKLNHDLERIRTLRTFRPRN